MKEIQIKTLLVEYLLKERPNTNVGSELPYMYGSRRADIFEINDGIATAYEIKGSNDSLDKLEYQIASYKSYFDCCYIVCEISNIKQIRTNIPSNIGLILVSASSVKVVRKSYLFKKLDKETLASTLPLVLLRKISKNRILRSKHELCSLIAETNTLKDVKTLSRTYLEEEYKQTSQLLRIDINGRINSDDILTITKKAPSLLKYKPASISHNHS